MRGEQLFGEDILYTVDAVVEERRQEAHLVSVAVVSRAARKLTRMHMLHATRYMRTLHAHTVLKERGDD